MSSPQKRFKQSSIKHHINETGQTAHHDLYDLVADHDFIAPYEICSNAIGYLSVLMNTNIIDMSFSKLFHQSCKHGWDKILTQEQQKLKPNDISVLKCIVLNRLLHEYSKDPDGFSQKTSELYDEIQSRMTRDFPSWTSRDLINEIQRCQDMQCRRRLFYFPHLKAAELPGLLMLQKASTNWCHCLFKHCQENRQFWEAEGPARLKEHFQNSFIIVAQPTGSEGTAVTQYVKTTTGHSARLNARIICLLDPDVFKDSIELPSIEVVLYPLDRKANSKREKQPSISWEIRKVKSADDVPVSIYYIDVHTLQLGKLDSVCKRLSLNSTLCQLEFRIKIKIKSLQFEETIILNSQPFGICSHAQYFPRFVAQIFLYEIKQILNDNKPTTDPDTIADFIGRYHIRMTGIQMANHSYQYVREIFANIIDDAMRNKSSMITDTIFEEPLAKIISQIDSMVLHPVLSLMYYDELFLGICNSAEVDQCLSGTEENPHLLLRFNSTLKHQWNSNAIVQFIIHTGYLKRASFDMRTFANEMCRFIYESTGDKTKNARVFSIKSTRMFNDFQWYFHDELHRLNKMAPTCKDTYDPLLPILWMTMRQNNDISSAIDSTTKAICGKKRRHSDTLPTIDSISTDNQSTAMNIVVNLQRKDSDTPEVIDICTTSNRSSTGTSITEKTCSSNDDKCRQFLIEIPGNLDISPAALFRYLGESFSNVTDKQDDVTSSNYFIRPVNWKTSLPYKKRPSYSKTTNSSPESNISDCDSISETLKDDSNIVNETMNDDHAASEADIKQEPLEIGTTIVISGMTCK